MRELLDCQSVMLLRYPENDFKEFNKDSYNKVDYGILAGVSYYFKKFIISARYVHGFQPIIPSIWIASDNNKEQTYNFNGKNRVIQLSIEYRF